MMEARQEITRIKSINSVDWGDVMDPLTEALEKVGRAWGVVTHMNSVKDTQSWRNEYNKMIPFVSKFYTEVSQDLELFEIFKKIKKNNFDNLTNEQQAKLKHDLRDFELSGACLQVEERNMFAELNSQLSMLASQFSQNVLDSTESFSLYFEEEADLKGIPKSDLDLFQRTAQEHGNKGYHIKLQLPYYLSVMKFAENRELRKKIHYAYSTRASELFDKGQWDNTGNINQILVKSEQQAKLLDYPDYASMSLATKMADDSDQVIEFIRDIVTKAKPVAMLEIQELEQFAKDDLGLDELLPWDIAFVSEKLRERKYAFSEEEVKKYFESNQVIEGLFKLINELYGVYFEEEKRPVWNPDVKYFRLLKNEQEIGSVYMDLYARSGKKSGAWMNDYCGRWKKSNRIQLPIAYLVCNFTPAPKQEKNYLNHEEIITLFHEMGHCLHHLLTQVDELGVSGISGVEWDAVELPSQFMENFAWEFDVLEAMSQHQETGETLPRNLFDKMRQAKNFQVGMFLLRQMEFALFDMQIYSQNKQPCNWDNIMQEVRKEISVVPQADYNRFAQSFEHVFAGGYSAGYYSYIWAQVLSADVYSAFLESGNRAETGRKFWQEILSKGGARPAMQSFIAFRGRRPKVDPLLEQLGLLDGGYCDHCYH
ncbi:MAG: M3 family peptidase [Neisseriaceae bacterium]|nr:MAG: M3 family peptidase [Neisseriaceae bacterium]